MTNIREKANKVIDILSREYPNTNSELNFSTPFEMLVATVLSAQSTDRQVNKITKKLFKKYKKPEDFVKRPIKEIEKDIYSSGFYKAKARYLKECSKLLLNKHKGKVPKTLKELVECPGIGRKTANVILVHAFNKVEGIAVDTHVKRLSQRIGLTKNNSPYKIERDLMKIINREKWGKVNILLVLHGRRVCSARKPKCKSCKISHLCESAFSF